MKKIMTKAVIATAITLSLSGCVGSNAVTGMLMKFNVEAVDNRYARGGVYFLLSPVYALTFAADFIVFNSLEFWTGSNPLTGSPHIFDTKTDTMLDINDSLDDSLKEAPISYNRNIQTGEMYQVDDNTIMMDITYDNGERATLIGVRDGEKVSYYIDGDLVSETSIQALESFAAEAEKV